MALAIDESFDAEPAIHGLGRLIIDNHRTEMDLRERLTHALPITATHRLVSRRAILSGIGSALLSDRSIAAGRKATSITVIPSTHKRLARNSRYSYADLYSLIAASRPDLVGVEIRHEDLARPNAYLHHNYAEEIVYLAKAYSGRVFGFDYGDLVADRSRLLLADLGRQKVATSRWRAGYALNVDSI